MCFSRSGFKAVGKAQTARNGKFRGTDLYVYMISEKLPAQKNGVKRICFTMAVLWLTKFFVVAVHILLRILFVLANNDFCGSVFETQVGR